MNKKIEEVKALILLSTVMILTLMMAIEYDNLIGLVSGISFGIAFILIDKYLVSK